MNHFTSISVFAILAATAIGCASATPTTGGTTDAATPDSGDGGSTSTGDGGSSTSDAGTSTSDAGSCNAHPHSSNPACDSCGQTSCPNEFAACFSGGQCAAYVTCFCACGDQACTNACSSKIDATCSSCVQALTACQKAKCPTECP